MMLELLKGQIAYRPVCVDALLTYQVAYRHFRVDVEISFEADFRLSGPTVGTLL